MRENKKRNLIIVLLIIIMLLVGVIGLGIGIIFGEKDFDKIFKKIEENQNNQVISNDPKYSQQQLEKMALDYCEKKIGYRPGKVASIVNNDGTISIQLYDSFNDHNSTSDWYIVDMNTAVGTNILDEKIDLKEVDL